MKTNTYTTKDGRQFEVWTITCQACGGEFETDNEDDLVMQLCGCQDDDDQGYGYVANDGDY